MVDTEMYESPKNYIISKTGNIANQKGGNPEPVIPDEMKTFCSSRGDIPETSKVRGQNQGTMSGTKAGL